MNYEEIGLKVGLEIHQQLDTSTKLFCSCKPELFKGEPEFTFLRRLRPTQSELGQIDPAAYFEFQKGVRVLYEADSETSCLVEMDEEPPHPLSIEALEIALTAALMMNAKPVDEIHTMRKTVIDGSNTTGFQRTCVVALNGEIKVGGKRVPIQHVSLEEDAARKTGEEGTLIRYRIDRLGIPLIEIATAPVINTPEEAGEVALAIGKILRATGKVRRGLGTIRQDLNISIAGGALTEIKGVQELELIPLVVEYEVQRQLNLIKISRELGQTGAREEDLQEEFYDVTEVFRETQCKVIRKSLDKGQRVLAVKLPKFSGFLGRELMPGIRLGTEMADRARFWGRVGGIFHTDELPAYGITVQEVSMLKKHVDAGEKDAVVFVVDTLENAKDALRAVLERAREALKGVPEETRAANPDGTTRYMRPRPGAARMYPETDIPPIQVTEQLIRKIFASLPEPPEQKLQRLMKDYRLNQKLASQVMDAGVAELFETIVNESKVSPTTVAVFLTETVKALKREGAPVERLSESIIREMFRAVGSGELAKEALQDAASWLLRNEGRSLKEAIDALGLRTLSMDELEEVIDKAIASNKSLIEKSGGKAFSQIMGIVMREVRGRANADLVSEIIRRKLQKLSF
ncbi:MAG: Glu-tRNA(Gln) amidotransferase subunit GatE [Candidatus Bathyarchaeota archaeon]|nr:Glu-tRNA(Gln) amidotransferase subunit GatE [Candidatus Bathyarchaeota archaeon]MCX8177026.1 Glu-tRNA(Gln) amidotransferase subunit GatE [Candidatus Bathyarchaeota archaeon]MDW8194235.1 Glu-tRNA(Gln) amidotransferase subunit GatE [Nitrososphaerota archaeon]